MSETELETVPPCKVCGGILSHRDGCKYTGVRVTVIEPMPAPEKPILAALVNASESFAIEERAKDRDPTIKAIREALKKRSGKSWSVKGGRGTAWGWIHVDAPPARRTFKHREKPGVTGYCPNWRDQYEEYDSGEPGNSMSAAETAELAKLLDVETGQVSGGIGIPASSDYRQEYIDRAEGRAPRVKGEPYWD